MIEEKVKKCEKCVYDLPDKDPPGCSADWGLNRELKRTIRRSMDGAHCRKFSAVKKEPSTLRPCPFCGKDDDMNIKMGSKMNKDISITARICYECGNCGAHGPWVEGYASQDQDIENAANAWNRRRLK